MVKINLLPKELQDKGKGLEYVVLGGLLIGIFALTGAGVYLNKYYAHKKNLEKKTRWTQQLEQVKAKVSEVEALDAKKSMLRAKKDAVVQLFQGRLLYPKVMEIFYNTLPKDVWVGNLTLTEDGSKNITIVALSNSLTTDGIASWLETLEAKPEFFSGIVLSAIESVKNADEKQAPVFKFSMTFVCKAPAAGI